ncbi:hypothetical protein TRIHO_00140 [Tritonibacter horizontis]|uniref:Transposase n=1 Tax=Tritonibacter horizontis TaxID=1768241 RepID=A0A132C3B7_9RHOB|nr:hypothetical protein TRIHO_00140 [Tritonibacter horizontis]
MPLGGQSESVLFQVPAFPSAVAMRDDGHRVLGGTIFIDHNGLRWRDAPKEPGPAKTRVSRGKRWSGNGVFARIMVGQKGRATARQVA